MARTFASTGPVRRWASLGAARTMLSAAGIVLGAGVLWASVAAPARAAGPIGSAVALPTPAGSIARIARARRLHAMLGQMLLIGFRGVSPDAPEVRRLRAQIAAGHVGGVIVQAASITSPAQVRRLTRALGDAAPPDRPLLIGIDQEGGFVTRLKRANGHRSFSHSARTVARRCTPRAARQLYAALACEVAAAGMNLNFGPVVDLDVAGRQNPIIGRLRRSYSPDAERVARYAQAFIAAHHTFGVLTSAKHFPGHGSSRTDSHKGFTAVPAWSATELRPYAALTQGAGEGAVDTVMVGHLTGAPFSDPRTPGAPPRVPASLSKRSVTDLLRNRIGYRGVVITDDLEMGAIRRYFGHDETLVRAIRAGNDILLLINREGDPRLGEKVVARLAQRVRADCGGSRDPWCVEERTIVAAYRRIMRLKARLAAWRARRLAAFRAGQAACEAPDIKRLCPGR